MTASVVSLEFYKILRIFRLDNFVKRVVFCYPRDIVGEFLLECKSDNSNSNNHNNDQMKKLPCLPSCRQIKFFVSVEVCNI